MPPTFVIESYAMTPMQEPRAYVLRTTCELLDTAISPTSMTTRCTKKEATEGEPMEVARGGALEPGHRRCAGTADDFGKAVGCYVRESGRLGAEDFLDQEYTRRRWLMGVT